MSLNKSITHGKEKRKPYRKAKAYDRSCRNHGDCPWCESGRQHFDKKKRVVADTDIKNWINGKENTDAIS